MIIKCKECGAEISSEAKNCPKCGCPNKVKSKSAITSLIFGIIAIVYTLGLCANEAFSSKNQPTVLPFIIIIGIIALVFGIVSIINKRNKMAICGILLAILSIVISIIAHIIL